MPVLNPVQVPLANPLANPLMNPVVQPVANVLSTPTINVNVVANPLATPLITAGWIGTFSVMGVATRVKQRKMVAMRNVSQGARKTPTTGPMGGGTPIGVTEG